MPLKTALAAALVFATLCMSTMPAGAADLADRRIEKLFAGEPVPVYKHHVRDDPWVPVIPFAYAPGYYGRMGDFGQPVYYGSSPLDLFGRAPYACWPAASGVC